MGETSSKMDGHSGSVENSMLALLASAINDERSTMIARPNPGDPPRGNVGILEAKSPTWQDVVTSKEFIYGAGAAMGAVVGVAMAPKVANEIGFREEGIKKDSSATSMMRRHGPSTPAGGVVATCQHVGNKNSVLGSPAATTASALTGAGIGLGIAAMAVEIAKLFEDDNDGDEDE
ncbi:uncharacterized protein LOC107039151 [Diachasma alloeum]|uniref:uncharacterized protein LOC107039151 n=1 Tax=Diachasma alloeum TaxID=454923 RepID=UPI0007381886|nr:uncharacterized protein LOC107039151 [Diachasma alloeum]